MQGRWPSWRSTIGAQWTSNGTPTGAAAENRKRRKKSEAQRQKGAQKLQHRWLQRRCEAAAAKPGGSPPKILARVLACCGRFFELLLPEGAERGWSAM